MLNYCCCSTHTLLDPPGGMNRGLTASSTYWGSKCGTGGSLSPRGQSLGSHVNSPCGFPSPCVVLNSGVESTPITDKTLVLVDTAGFEMVEGREEEDGSTHNEGEARIVMEHARKLREAGVESRDVGIITPYSAQVGRVHSCNSTLYRTRSQMKVFKEVQRSDGQVDLCNSASGKVSLLGTA